MCRFVSTLAMALALASGFAFAEQPPSATSPAADPHAWIERGAFTIEALAVAVIIGFIAVATINWLYHVGVRRASQLEYYDRYRRRLARSLLLGLEILVAADIVRTVALRATLQTIVELGLLVLIRTFLSWSIVVEIEGRWPWQPRPPGQTGEERV